MSIAAIFSFGSFLYNAVKTGVRILHNVFEAVDEVIERAQKPRTTNTASQTIRLVKDVDAEIAEMERKRKYDRGLSSCDEDRQEELLALKQEKFTEYQAVKTQEVSAEVKAKPEQFVEAQINDKRINILQFHVGQFVLEKRCRLCQRPMILQHKRKPIDYATFNLSDFFWGCSGHYDKERKCYETQPFQSRDMSLLHKSGIPDLEASSDELNIIFSTPPIQKATLNRVADHLRDEDEDSLCPVHNVPMILREKRDHQGHALDMYFLTCPHFECDYVQKLKSPSQLAAFLHRKEGRGIC